MSDETSAAIAGEAGLLRELAAALNRRSVENESDTPDFVLAEYARTCLDAFALAIRARDKHAGRAAASSEPRTIPPLTDAECLAQINAGRNIYVDYRHFYALAASRLGATVAAPGAMSEKQAEFLTSPDLDAIKREAARKAWEYLAKQLGTRVYVPPAEMLNEARDRYLAEAYPAPVPEPPHVEVTDDIGSTFLVCADADGWYAKNHDGTRGQRQRTVTALVKAYSLDVDDDILRRVLALREGRGDQ